jgi:PHS family inorganic phosphate transporter-like MFS transporter
MFVGIFTSMLIPETKRKTLEDLAGEYDMAPIDLHAEEVAAGKIQPKSAVTPEEDNSV